MALSYTVLIESLSGEVETRVGSVGKRHVHVSGGGEKLETIQLSRGGVLIPGQSSDEHYEARRRNHLYTGGDRKGQMMYPNAQEPEIPTYNPSLAVVSHHVGVDGHDGLDFEGGTTTIDGEASHEYVLFHNIDDGLWHAYDAFGEQSSDYWTDTTTFFLDAARAVTERDELIAVQGLIVAFDQVVLAQSERAVVRNTGLLPQGQ